MKNRNRKMDRARKVLGISRQATADEAKKKYRELAKKWHPDKNAAEDAPARMRDINQAYALLMKEEYGLLDPWEAFNRWWWRQYGSDPIWGNDFPEENTEGLCVEHQA